MVLKSLQMQGFKSFPDRTKLTFDKGITTVVGPNGSGKSNIADAVRWVLGEQSTKSLRGSSMEDVVFNGTETRNKLGYAEVTLELENKDRKLATDSDLVAVTRKYYRSGESEYIINNENVRLRDVRELFMDTGLGRDGYSLVGQGKVSNLISSRSTKRREMLEEAAGIAAYRYRRTDAERRLTQAEDNLDRLRDILLELEDRIEPLRKQSKKAQKFLVLAEERKEKEIGLWLYELNEFKASLRLQESKISVAKTQYDEAEQALADIEKEIDVITENMQEHTLEIEAFRKERSEVEENILRIDGNVALNKSAIVHNNETVERILRDKEETTGTREHIDEKISSANEQIDLVLLQIGETNKSIQETTKSLTLLSERAGKMDSKTENLRKDVEKRVATLSEKRIGHESALVTLSQMEERLETLMEREKENSERVDEFAKEKEKAEKDFIEATQAGERLANSHSGYEKRLAVRMQRMEESEKEYNTLNNKSEQIKARISMLEELEKNMEGYSGAVKAVMRASKAGRLRGIHAPLSQLITTPPKYALAIETALGAAVQYIVTDNDTHAKSAIQFLKQGGTGRATFLPISAIRKRSLTEQQLENSDGFIGIASDLVTIDSKFSDVLDAQIGRTVVADTIDNAVAMAKSFRYRFRIVTLDGQVIHAGGSMTGGSRVSRAGLLSRGNEIIKLKKEYDALLKEVALQSSELNAVTGEFEKAKADLDGTAAELQRARQEYVRAETYKRGVLEKLDDAKRLLQNSLAEKEHIEKRGQELKVESKTLEEETSTLQSELKSLQEKLSSLSDGGKKFVEERSVLDEKAHEFSLSLALLQKDEVEQRNIVHALESRKEGHVVKLSEFDDEVKEYKTRNKEIEEKIIELEAGKKNLRSNEGAFTEKMQAVTEKRNECEKRITQLRLLEREKSRERENMSGELVRLEERKTNMMRENDETISKLYDEYELSRHEAFAQFSPTENPREAATRLASLRSKIRALGSVNVAAIEEYKDVAERFEFLSKQIEDVETARGQLLDLIGELTGQMGEQFSEQFQKINEHFATTFVELFGGGKAELILDNPANALESDIGISVQPPGKAIQNIDLLSGGEKGLAAIALLFAILKVTPSPFCVFDEVEAALDDVNVVRFAKYVRRMTKNTQFILITHRRGTMEEADVLYGVTMQEKGVSKLLELQTAKMAEEMGIA